MKNRAYALLKRVISVLSSMAKAKSMAVKNKTSAVKGRLIVYSLLKNKKVSLGSISHKIHTMLGQQDKRSHDDVGDQSKAIVLYNNAEEKVVEEEDDKYPDLTHSLFDADELDFVNEGGSIVDLVKNSKEEGEDFRLEDDIDQVADLFIMRFHKQMRMQKLESFKRYQDMLNRSV